MFTEASVIFFDKNEPQLMKMDRQITNVFYSISDDFFSFQTVKDIDFYFNGIC